MENGRVVAERLARCRRRRDDNVATRERVFDGFALMCVELADATCLESRPQSAIERFRKGDVLGSDGSETSNRRDVQIRSVWTICKAIGNESFERRIERAVTSHSRGQSVSRGRSPRS